MSSRGCRIQVLRENHERKCQVCDMPSATLYVLQVGIQLFRICPLCKATLRSDIEKIDGPGDDY
jgi:hypothetical protein